MIISRSSDTPSGRTATNRTPSAAHAMAKAIDVEPLEASTTVVSGPTCPSATARARTWAANRSFVDPLGSWYSSFSQIVQPEGSSRGTVGVPAPSRGSSRAGSNVLVAGRTSVTASMVPRTRPGGRGGRARRHPGHRSSGLVHRPDGPGERGPLGLGPLPLPLGPGGGEDRPLHPVGDELADDAREGPDGGGDPLGALVLVRPAPPPGGTPG